MKSLTSVATVIMGQSPPGDTYNDRGEGLPLLNGPTEFGQTYPRCTLFTVDSRRECEPGDLIFCVRGSTTGRMNWADRKFSLGRGVCAIRSKSVLETRFIRYCIQHQLQALLNFAGGGTFPNLTKETIEEFEIPWPDNRIRIATILAAYDDLIENNARRIKILEEMASALYREWFVEFKFPMHERIARTASALGPIPTGWEVKPVPEVVQINPRVYIPRNGDVPFVPMGCLANDSMLISDIERRAEPTGAKFQNGDTLFARITPCLENGKTAFVQFLPDPGASACGSTEFIVLRSRTLTPEFVYLLARSEEFRANAIKSMSGASGRQRVQERCFDSFKIAVPPRPLLERFSAVVAPSFALIQRLHLESDNLRRTRDLLLPRLLSGQVPTAPQEMAKI